MGVHETKTFKSGNSVALRLPKGLGYRPDEPVVIEQNGDEFTVRRVVDPAEEKRLWLKMLDDLARLPKAPRQKRERIIFPKRAWS